MRVLRHWATAVALSIVILISYNWLNWTPSFRNVFPWVSGGDGAFYALRLKAALEGDRVLSCVQDPSLARKTMLSQQLIEVAWASLLRPFVGNDVGAAIKVTYCLLPLILFWLYFLFLRISFGKTPLLSVLALWALLEPGTYGWKPLSFDLYFAEPFPYSRFVNPLLFQVFFVGALCAVADLARRTGPIRSWIILLTGLCIGMLFYTPVYDCEILGVTLFLFACISAVKGEPRKAIPVLSAALIGLAIGSPVVLNALRVAKTPELLELLHRSGMVVSNHHPYFLFHKAFWATFISYQLFYWRRPKDWLWQLGTAGMLAGYLCLNQNIITGLSSQDHHFFRPMMAIYVFVVADIGTKIWPALCEKIGAWGRVGLPIALCALITCKAAWTNMETSNAAETKWGFLQAGGTFEQTVHEMAKVPPEFRGLMLEDQNLSYLTAVRSGIPIYVNDYLSICAISDQQVFFRWSLYMKSFGRSPVEVEDFLTRFIRASNLPWWLYGMPDTYLGPRDRYSDKIYADRARSWVTAYSSLSVSDLLKQVNQMPRLILESPGYRLDQSGFGSFVRLKILFEVPQEGTRLWLIEGAR